MTVVAAGSSITTAGNSVSAPRAVRSSATVVSPIRVRVALSTAMIGTKYQDVYQMAFARPLPARNWLQASNPSERWKWDFMFQDLPPVKGHNVQLEGEDRPAHIPLRPVE